MPTLSVIVPVHNEQAGIAPFYERIKPVLDATGCEWRLLFVNDFSTDGSLSRIMDLRAKDQRVRVLTFSRNFGYHAVLVAGLTKTEADLYAIVDADCEDPPELLGDFFKEISAGAQTAYGIRSKRDEAPGIVFFRWLFYLINRSIADGPVRLWMAEFCMMTRTVRDAVLANKTTFPFLRAELGFVGYKMVGVPYFRARRKQGASHYNFFSMTRFAVGGFLSSSTFPLRLALYLAGGFAAGYVLLLAWLRPGLAGAAQLAQLLDFAFMLATIPMIALYLARTYKNVSGRPVYFVDPDRTHLS